MHPQNPFLAKPPDFKQLATKYPKLAQYCHGRTMDFANQDAARALSKVLLLEYFGLAVELPAGNLVPMIPNRGVGASCIYPLLGCATNSNWKFVGTEIDEDSLRHATDNVARNTKLIQDRIRLYLTKDPKHIMSELDINHHGPFHFVMCNPPFYRDSAEIEACKQLKRTRGTLTTSFTSNESIYVDGGEVEFVTRMFEESLALRDRICWFTSLLGKKQSLLQLRQKLSQYCEATEARVSIHIEWSRFQQGRTVRWAIGWTFQPINKQSTLCKRKSVALSKEPNTQLVAVPKTRIGNLLQLQAILKDLEATVAINAEQSLLTCQMGHITWTRSARRKSKPYDPTDLTFTIMPVDGQDQDHGVDEFSLQFQLVSSGNTTVDFGTRWNDFISLCNHLRKLGCG